MATLDVIKKLGQNVTVQRSILQLRKHSPTILITAGVASVVASTVMIARQSMNVQPLLDQHRADVAHLKELRENSLTTETGRGTVKETYPERQFNKDMLDAHVRTGKELVKRYGPPVTLGVLGLSAIIGAHGILHQRNVALGVAYKGLESAFTEYRKRVIEKDGPEVDRDYRFGIYEDTEIDPETGKKKKVTRIGALQQGEYTKWFDNENRNWDPTPGYSLMFLRAQQTWANQLLWSRGHVFLNDIYDALGFERSPEGQQVGWLYKKGAPSEDNYIDFGIYDIENDAKRNFVNGKERYILLDFNVHGIIWDQI